MGKQENIEQSIRILESIVERANSIHDNPNRELCLDIDLMLEDLRLLYRRVELLKKQCECTHTVAENKDGVADQPSNNHSSAGEEAGSTVEQTVEEPSSTDQEIPSFFTDTPSDDPSEPEPGDMAETPARSETPNPETPSEQPSASASRPEEQQEAAPQSDQPRTDASKGSNGKTVIDLFSQSSSPSIGDQFGRHDNSLHQRISSQKEDRSIGARLQQHPIDNIKDAIGLNEKFLFINELFNGDIQAYNEAIAKLNSIGSLQQAFDYLNELTKSQNVDTKRSAETLEKLAGFVQRRYLNS